MGILKELSRKKQLFLKKFKIFFAIPIAHFSFMDYNKNTDVGESGAKWFKSLRFGVRWCIIPLPTYEVPLASPAGFHPNMIYTHKRATEITKNNQQVRRKER